MGPNGHSGRQDDDGRSGDDTPTTAWGSTGPGAGRDSGRGHGDVPPDENPTTVWSGNQPQPPQYRHAGADETQIIPPTQPGDVPSGYGQQPYYQPYDQQQYGQPEFGAAQTPAPQGATKRRGVLGMVLLVVAALVALALILVVFVFGGDDDDTPAPASTTQPAPRTTQEQTPEDEPSAPGFQIPSDIQIPSELEDLPSNLPELPTLDPGLEDQLNDTLDQLRQRFG
ncbi:hypothetical protein PQI66_04625 [Corynebacterium sp. USCH3]|uniref:hypothetical protein n=1 Tax=Corynebacterium sp. USCH3 TaxID=3024840 RepID=UPI0030A5678E